MKESNDFPILIFGDLNDPLRFSYSGDTSGSPEKLDALLVKPGMHPQRITIGNDYDSLRSVVAEHLDFMSLCTDNAVTIVNNAFGKIDGSEANRAFMLSGNMVDIINGNFLIVADDVDSGNFCSLTEKQYEEFEKMFYTPRSSPIVTNSFCQSRFPSIWSIKP